MSFPDVCISRFLVSFRPIDVRVHKSTNPHKSSDWMAGIDPDLEITMHGAVWRLAYSFQMNWLMLWRLNMIRLGGRMEPGRDGR